MANHVVEYIIQAKDRATAILQSAAEQWRRYAASVAESMSKAKTAVADDRAEEKFIRTEAVLDAVSKAMDRMGVTGERFNDVYDTLERRLNNFNRTGKGFEELMEHFKLSMEDVGMSAKGVSHGIEILKENLVGVGDKTTNAASVMRSDFRAMHSLVSGLNGNVYALGRAFTYLIGRFGALKVSAGVLSGIGIAVFAVVEVVKRFNAAMEEQRRKLEELKNLRFERTLASYAAAQKEVNEEFRKGQQRIADEVERKRAIIEQNRKIIEQELEIARIQATRGKSGEELEGINRSFDSQRALLNAQAEIDRALAEASGEEAQANLIGRLEGEIQKARERVAPELGDFERQLRSMADDKRRELERKYEQMVAGAVRVDPVTGETSYMSQKEVRARQRANVRAHRADIEAQVGDYMLSDEAVKKVREKRDKLREQLDGLNDDLEEYKKRREKALARKGDLENEAGNIAADHDISAWEKEERAAAEYYESVEERERLLEAERLEAERRVHMQRLRDAQDEAQAMYQAQNEAMQRLNRAQTKVDEAWGFYKNRDALKAYDDEQDRDRAARRQYEEDLKSITTGRNADRYGEILRLYRKEGQGAVEDQFAEWRRKQTISLDTEATMRVALSESEQKEAYRNLERAAEAAEDSRACLERIANTMEEG